MYAYENQAKQSLQNDKKTVYMFSNIFVLYYIQLSLLKNGIQMIIILQDRGDTKQSAPCHLQDCDMARGGSVCRGLREKRWIGAVLKGFCPVSYSFFSSSLGERLPPTTHTGSHGPCTLMCRLGIFPARSKALL